MLSLSGSDRLRHLPTEAITGLDRLRHAHVVSNRAYACSGPRATVLRWPQPTFACSLSPVGPRLRQSGQTLSFLLPYMIVKFKEHFYLSFLPLTWNSCLHSLHFILFCLTTSFSDKCSRQIESAHGNMIGSFNIFEQYEHVQFDFNLNIIWVLLILIRVAFKTLVNLI